MSFKNCSTSKANYIKIDIVKLRNNATVNRSFIVKDLQFLSVIKKLIPMLMFYGMVFGIFDETVETTLREDRNVCRKVCIKDATWKLILKRKKTKIESEKLTLNDDGQKFKRTAYMSICTG